MVERVAVAFAQVPSDKCTSQICPNTTILGEVNGSSLQSFLWLLIGDYFFTLLIVGLVAALISLSKKPKPLKFDAVAEAFLSYYMLFRIGISNLINFVFHVFLWRYGSEVYRLGKQPIPG